MYEGYAVYKGEDLGAVYYPDCTRFRVWAPTAQQMVLRLYRTGSGNTLLKTVSMLRDIRGTWIWQEKGDCHGVYYTYQAQIRGSWKRETYDPYARACGVNGFRSMVVDLARTDPYGFEYDRGPALSSPVDMIVSEISVADATGDPSCRAYYPGKFLGLTERGLTTMEGVASGLDHFVELGVTHLQIMPFFDSCSMDESKPDRAQYNWGYDPMNYNIPEGRYSTDPFNGEVRIQECKQMIQAIHQAGMGVIMDVVYNHVYDAEGGCFQQLVPNYYFRHNGRKLSNGSGCGNETASERAMVSKYMLDSLKYWVREYHVDGFRFDLMGLHDKETMRRIEAELHRIRPDLVMYGEGWTGGDSPLPAEERLMKSDIAQVEGVGVFSDDIRNHLKGHPFDVASRGFATGEKNMENEIRFCSVGAVWHPQVDYEHYWYSGGKAWAASPAQCVNYVSCHDNMTLWDKLTVSCPKASEEEKLAMNRLCAGVVMTSQGIPFFLSGEEFARSKPLDDGRLSGNSYNLPLAVNSLKYDRISRFRKLFDYYKGLIAFRKAHPALRLATPDKICSQLNFLKPQIPNVVAFCVADRGEELLIVYNANEKEQKIRLGTDSLWSIFVNGDRAGTESIGIASESVTVEGRSVLAAMKIRA